MTTTASKMQEEAIILPTSKLRTVGYLHHGCGGAIGYEVWKSRGRLMIPVWKELTIRAMLVRKRKRYQALLLAFFHRSNVWTVKIRGVIGQRSGRRGNGGNTSPDAFSDDIYPCQSWTFLPVDTFEIPPTCFLLLTFSIFCQKK